MPTRKNQQGALENKHSEPSVSYTTEFNGPASVGALSSGSGDIHIGDLASVMNSAGTKDEFLAALRAFKAEIESVQSLSTEAADDVVVEIEAAEREVLKAEPQSVRVTKRLENAQKIITAAASAAGATATLYEALSKLSPFTD